MPDIEKVIEVLKNCEEKSESVFYALNETILRLKGSEQGWISVKDKLPDMNTPVLIFAKKKGKAFTDGGIIDISTRFVQKVFPSAHGHVMWSEPFHYFNQNYDITHWMLLPEAPMEGR